MKMISNSSICAVLMALWAGVGFAQPAGDGKGKKAKARVEKSVSGLSDSAFGNIKTEDLLDDEVYLKLAREGWSKDEIVTIMNTVMKDKGKAKQHDGYGKYSKQFLPYDGRLFAGDSLFQYIDTAYNPVLARAAALAAGEDVFNKVWPKKVYSPEDRKAGIRDAGYFRTVEHKPSSGRIRWGVVHPENEDWLYINPDGTGIFKTYDGGDSWECITDNIPDRVDRSQVAGYSIPVDPDDWNHLFAFTGTKKVYETFDGGETWSKIEGASSGAYKRGYCFRDKQGTLRFIVCSPSTYNSGLWISEDMCRTWTRVNVPNDMKEPTGGVWFQQVEQDPENRDMIYVPGSRSLYYFDDGARPTIVNGQKTYNLKRKDIVVYADKDKTQRRMPADAPTDTKLFPIEATSPGFMVWSTLEPNKIWYACGIRATTKSALYYSEDKGETWVTLHDQPAGIGNSSCLFGNEAPWAWLGGFGVDLAEPNWMYGCSMSSAISSDGGNRFWEYAWGNRLKSKQDDGNYYYVSNSRHNADNHFILSHKSGRVYRGSDGGLFVRDKNINNREWTNIGSNMGQMLYYNIRCNEFGDQLMVGNTQDIDVQTYRYGRWGHWRGYEGCESWINPYTSTCYFSGGGGGGWEDMTLSSWRSATCWADVFTGSWYMSRNGMGAEQSFFRVDDTGRSVVNLFENVGEGVRQQYALIRSKDHNTIVVYTASNRLKKSIDGGNTFTTIKTNTGVDVQLSSITLASGSDEENILYIASSRGSGNFIWKYNIETGTYDDITYNLGGSLKCGALIYHEGSGDLYFSNADMGIYILEKGSTAWRYWTKGYNPAKFGDIQINYTTQEMVISDYGRGVWVADLEHPADRFFKDGFELKELSHIDGRRTLGIDTKWTIPLYYYYKWTVNGEEIDNPYQYLSRSLNAGDKVQLTLTLRESPDVQTTSAVYTVGETADAAMARKAGNALYSNGKGRIDLGYFDCFFNDFTVDFWLKPMGNGVVLGNRQMSYDKGAKGWFLFVEGGQLKMRYSPRNIFSAPTYENGSQGEGNYTVSAGAIALNQWSHVALTQERNGNIKLYINGECKSTNARMLPTSTLNNSMYMSLFADAFEYNAIEAAVDELKIWNKALTADDLKKEMFATNPDNQDGLVVHYDFNGENLLGDIETFTGYTPRVRIRAEVKHERMTKPIAAQKAFLDADNDLLTVTPAQEKNYSLGSFGYNADEWMEGGNLSAEHFDLMPLSYMVHSYASVAATDVFTVTFKPAEGTTFDPNRRYRLYYDDGDAGKSFWVQYSGELTYDDGVLKMEGMKAGELFDKRIVIAALKPAIEVAVEGLGKTGELEVYTEDDNTTYQVRATLLEGLAEPVGGNYEFESTDNILFTPQAGFEFVQGKATADLRVNHDKLPAFNQRITTYLQGKANDKKMIPVPIDVVNRISPKELGNSVLLDHGSLTVGITNDYTCMNNSNTVTIMGWMRVDSLYMLTDTNVKGLMFFRNSKANGLHLQNGNLRCHWNDESWSWNQSTPFTLTEADLGRWIHVALVARPDGMDYYMNGAKYTVNRTINKARFDSEFMLGTDRNGNANFSGAFDQVSVWNRSLTQEEVVRYMQERVLLNAPGLVAYVTMDEVDGSQLVEVKNNSTIKEYGRITKNHRSIVPFNPINRYTNAATHPETASGDNHDGEAVELGSGSSFIHMASTTATIPSHTITTFEGMSVGSYNPERPDEVPLSREFYTLIYDSTPAYGENDEITLYYHDENILDGDRLELGVRPLGTEQPFEIIATDEEGRNDVGEFTFPARLLRQAVEMNVFVMPNENDRPIEIVTRFAGNITNGSTYMLTDDNLTIPFIVRVTSTDGKRTQLPIFVKETDYASLDKDTIDLTRTTATTYTVTIDKERLPDKFGLNPITIVAPNEDDSLHLNIYLEPRVELRLKNGIDEHTFVATSPVSTLDIEAELVEGMFDKDVELYATSAVTSSMSIGGGTLLSDRAVTIGQLEYIKSPEAGNEMNEGWNLIGNPYLANVNLTKQQNVTYDGLTRFIYQYDKLTENYITTDMVNYDEEQKIMPFQSYFVQALNDVASITITPTAREKKMSRKTFDYYTATERTSVRLKMYAGGKPLDRTDIIWEDGSEEGFVVDEDAAKMWSLNAAACQLFSMAEDRATAVNTVPLELGEIPLGINVGTPGQMTIRLEGMNGFHNTERLFLLDNADGNRVQLQLEAEYTFNADAGYYPGRFCLQVERDPVDIAQPATHSYGITVHDRLCTIGGLQGDAQISIVSTAGQIVAREACAKPECTIQLPEAGIYVVRIRENGKDYTAKILVK